MEYKMIPNNQEARKANSTQDSGQFKTNISKSLDINLTYADMKRMRNSDSRHEY